MKVSIVIPVKNGEQTLESTLSAIFGQNTDNELEVIAIDSGSTDKSVEIVKSFKKVLLHEIEPALFNHGLTRNMGVKMSEGELIVMLTQDALPSNDRWLSNLIRPFCEPDVAGVFCRQIPREEASVVVKRHLNSWVTGGLERVEKKITNRNDYEALSPSEKHILCTFDNVCSCIRRSVWREIPFRKTDFAEDLIWSKEVLEKGWKIVYEPEAAVIHSHKRSLRWEYERDYICHKALNELFGMTCVPTIMSVLTLCPLVAASDIYNILKYEPGLARKIKYSVRAPFSAFARLYGQYRGAKESSKTNFLTEIR